jgi:hypothetical protein
MSHIALTGHRHSVSDLPREAALQRLEDAETVVRRALQTVERQVHLTRNGSEDDSREMMSTVERELEFALAGLRGAPQEAGGSGEISSGS